MSDGMLRMDQLPSLRLIAWVNGKPHLLPRMADDSTLRPTCASVRGYLAKQCAVIPGDAVEVTASPLHMVLPIDAPDWV